MLQPSARQSHVAPSSLRCAEAVVNHPTRNLLPGKAAAERQTEQLSSRKKVAPAIAGANGVFRGVSVAIRLLTSAAYMSFKKGKPWRYFVRVAKSTCAVIQP